MIFGVALRQLLSALALVSGQTAFEFAQILNALAAGAAETVVIIHCDIAASAFGARASQSFRRVELFGGHNEYATGGVEGSGAVLGLRTLVPPLALRALGLDDGVVVSTSTILTAFSMTQMATSSAPSSFHKIWISCF